VSSARPKVLVAMSGGVDSSVAAALLLHEGYDVVGCFMRLGSPGETIDELRADACEPGAARKSLKIGHQGCCSINDAADARLVAAELGIPFYVCNFKKDFGRIIDHFVDEYAMGRTPNPCVRCNDWLKFGRLHDYAGQVGASFVASGHYARIEGTGDDAAMLRGVDRSKDQSYVLFGAPRSRLGSMLLPIGGIEKPRVRELARRFGLPVFDKPDSQEICFVPDNDYAGLVERMRPETRRPGRIVDVDGADVGGHDGQHRFTIGQRRGLDIALGQRVYVVGKDASANTVTIGSRADLLASGCVASEANWLVDPLLVGEPLRCLAKYRYNSEAVGATARVIEGGADAATPSGRTGRFEVTFDVPESAVAPGQAIVLYDAPSGERVLGGGWIGAVTPVSGGRPPASS